MTTAAIPQRRSLGDATSRLLRTGALIAVVDGSWAVVLTFLYGKSQAKLWQGIAATLFGPRMLDAGASAVALGIAMHVGVAFAWTAVFLLIVTRSAAVRRVLGAPYGPLAIAAVYGPLIWIVMSAAVIPLLTGRPLVLTGRWWIQLLGHVVFVGLPIAWGIGRWTSTQEGQR